MAEKENHTANETKFLMRKKKLFFKRCAYKTNAGKLPAVTMTREITKAGTIILNVGNN